MELAQQARRRWIAYRFPGVMPVRKAIALGRDSGGALARRSRCPTSCWRRRRRAVPMIATERWRHSGNFRPLSPIASARAATPSTLQARMASDAGHDRRRSARRKPRELGRFVAGSISIETMVDGVLDGLPRSAGAGAATRLFPPRPSRCNRAPRVKTMALLGPTNVSRRHGDRRAGACVTTIDRVRDVLRALSLDAPQGRLLAVVLAGLVTAAEFVRYRGGRRHPLCRSRRSATSDRNRSISSIIGIAATLATAIFHAQRLYTPLAFRRPVSACLRMAGGWTLARPRLHRGGVLPQGWKTSSRASGWPRWFVVRLRLAVSGRARSRALCRILAHAGRLQRRAVVVGGGDFGREAAARARRRPTPPNFGCSASSTIAATPARRRSSKASPSSARSTISSSSPAARASIWSSSRCRSPPSSAS